MRATIQRMITSGSLSAFSASALSGSAASGAVSGARPVQQASAVRAQSSPAPAQATGPTSRPPVQMSPGQTMPRGSLLDLSV